MKWSDETINIINQLTPDIKGKAFSPDWFLLAERFREVDEKITKLEIGLREALDLAGQYGPEKAHKGSCHPDAGCDGLCQDVVYYGDKLNELHKLLPK